MGRREYREQESAPNFRTEALEYARRKAKTQKVTGADGIPVNLLKCTSKKSKEKLLKSMNKMYKTGLLTDDFKISTFVTILKKNNPRKCAEWEEQQTAGQYVSQ